MPWFVTSGALQTDSVKLRLNRVELGNLKQAPKRSKMYDEHDLVQHTWLRKFE